jgi:hypothetical protein
MLRRFFVGIDTGNSEQEFRRLTATASGRVPIQQKFDHVVMDILVFGLDVA